MTIREELSELTGENSQAAQKQPKTSVKDEVYNALQEFTKEQKKSVEEAEKNEKMRVFEQQRLQEQQDRDEVAQLVKSSLQEEMQKDRDFKKTIQNSDLPGALVDYIAEVGEADEAPLIVRELAGNDEYQQTLKRAKSSIGVKRLISKIRKQILTGGNNGQVPPMLKKNIPSYNPNSNPSDYDQSYYSELAVKHGI